MDAPAGSTPTNPLYADLVMEGGGVKGVGLVGAAEVLTQHGYQFQRIAGASAGAIVGAFLAAGMPVDEARQIMLELDFKRFKDPTFWSNFGTPGRALSLILTQSMYRGRHLRRWLRDQLAAYNVHTFADLRLDTDWAQRLPPAQRYKLVVIVADIGRGRLLRLPWDYHLLGLDPDKQLVANAVRASASIPFFYKAVKMGDTALVDGGLISNFPVSIFDAYPSSPAWPTFGIKLSSREDANLVENDVKGVLSFPLALLDTLINAYDQSHLDDPATTARTIFVDTDRLKATNFDITSTQRETLWRTGQDAAERFLQTWDFPSYIKEYIEPRLPKLQ